MRAYLEGELGSAHSRGTSNTTLPPRDAPAASSSVARGEEERHADEGKRGAAGGRPGEARGDQEEGEESVEFYLEQVLNPYPLPPRSGV